MCEEFRSVTQMYKHYSRGCPLAVYLELGISRSREGATLAAGECSVMPLERTAARRVKTTNLTPARPMKTAEMVPK
ncbi:hypothetical protein EVAR_31282_1 [Eumeta japonica]|uniref:Uncharacterized protein n=1 Tax=Eumeta variegata TaxID=151549 RepID=A0A4C1VS41_EUMVA|nr:hypothetical protein EVAR_31282_1 [Eumeta japonica]